MKKTGKKNLLHSSAIVIGNQGVLILGESGSGKSTLAHALIDHAQRHDIFARWVGDDQLEISETGPAIVARAVETIAGKAEQPFNGVLDVDHVPSARIDLVVQLVREDELERMPEEATSDLFPEVPALSVPHRSAAIGVTLIVKRLGI